MINDEGHARTVATINSRTASVRSIGSKKEKNATAAARFTIYKVNKASRKKREKSSAKKERKATKTLAIVLGLTNFRQTNCIKTQLCKQAESPGE
ncbi:hypothetical protein YQE_06044, partial [Dendroctonus ponderosae]